MDFFVSGVLLVVSAYICTTQALPPCTCTRNYQPICGSDGSTYANQCLLECAQYTTKKDITAVREGPCEDPLSEEKPVCGSDGTTYSNDCLLNCATKNNHRLSIEHYGPCTDKVKVVDNIKF